MVLPNEARQRVVSYLAHQARKDVSAICDSITEERARLLSLLEGVSDEQAAFAPAPGQWSTSQIVAHVVAAEGGVAAIIGRLSGAPAGSGVDAAAGAESGADLSLAELRSELLEARERLLGVVARAPDDADLEEKHDHPFFGPLNWKEWLAFQRVHDRDHVGQIEAIQQSPSYPKGD